MGNWFGQLWALKMQISLHKSVKSSAESAKREEAAKQGEVFEIKIKKRHTKKAHLTFNGLFSLVNI